MPKDFDSISEAELRALWRKYSDEMIAEMYGVTKQQVKMKRKEFGITPITNALYGREEELIEYLKGFKKPNGGKVYNIQASIRLKITEE